jgi:hypothetical protein
MFVSPSFPFACSCLLPPIYSHQDPNLWVQALSYFASKTDCKDKIVEVLKQIEENNLMPPLMVVQTLSESPCSTLSDIKVGVEGGGGREGGGRGGAGRGEGKGRRRRKGRSRERGGGGKEGEEQGEGRGREGRRRKGRSRKRGREGAGRGEGKEEEEGEEQGEGRGREGAGRGEGKGRRRKKGRKWAGKGERTDGWKGGRREGRGSYHHVHLNMYLFVL